MLELVYKDREDRAARYSMNIIYLVLFGLSWGLTVPLIKIAVSAGHHPLGLLFWQMFLSALMLGLYLLVKRQRLPLSRTAIVYYLIIAVIGTLIPNSFSLVATSKLPAGIMAIVIATVPIMSLFIALLARLERFSWQRSLGVVLGVCALMLIALPEAGLPDPAMAPWMLVALIAPLCYAIEGNFVSARGPRELSPVVTLFGASVLGSAFLAPIVWLNGYGVSMTSGMDKSLWALLGSSVGHVIAYCGYLWLLARAGAVFTSQVAYVVTLTGVLGAVLMLGERYGILVWAAVALMLLGVSLVRPVVVGDEALVSTPQ